MTHVNDISREAYPPTVVIIDHEAEWRPRNQKYLEENGFRILATSGDPKVGRELCERLQPDVIVCTYFRHENAMELLQELLQKAPQSKLVLCLSKSHPHREQAMASLTMGVMDLVVRPDSASDDEAAADFLNGLCRKLKAITNTERVLPPSFKKAESKPAEKAATGAVATPVVNLIDPGSLTKPKRKPLALAIGSSTGGPPALTAIFQSLKGRMPDVPVFITQHMPPVFTTTLAEHIAQASGQQCKEAVDGEEVTAGNIYLAPGDYHLACKPMKSDGLTITLNQDPPENFCRPAVDPMLRSLSDYYGERLMVMILTGMGQDGMAGAQYAREKGAFVLIQDEASSVVWGMPGAVYRSGAYDAMLPKEQIPDFLAQIFVGGRI